MIIFVVVVLVLVVEVVFDSISIYTELGIHKLYCSEKVYLLFVMDSVMVNPQP